MDSAATEGPPASVSAEEEDALLQDPASTESQSEPPKAEAVTESQEVTESEQAPAPEETPAQLAPIEIQPTDEEPTPMETEETPLEVAPQEEPPAPSTDVPQEQMEPLNIQPEPEDPNAMETENSAPAEESGKDSPAVEAGTSTGAGESEDGAASKDAAENSGLQIASVTSGEEVPNIPEQGTNTEAGATGDSGAEMPLLKEQDIKTEEPAELKNYATDTVNELLGMYGMDGLNEKEKEKVKVNEQLGQVPADQNQAQEPEEDKKDKQGEKKEKSSKSKTPQPCIVCKKVKKCKYNIVRNGDIKHLCDDQCFKAFRANPSFYLKNENKNVESSNGAAEPVETVNVEPSPMQQKAVNIAPVQAPPVGNTPRMAAPPMHHQPIAPRAPAQSGLPQGTKVCGQCQVLSSRSNKRFIIWNGVNFCDEKCLACYQTRHTGTCEGCKKILPSGTSAKFYLRQGSEMKQFCNSTCLDEYKNRLNIRTVPSTKTFSKKACFMCNKDITSDKDSFMAPVGKESSFEEFCSRACMQRCEARGGKKDVQLKEGASVGQIAPCAICKMNKPIRHKVLVGQVSSPLCGDQCLAAFNMAHKINPTCDYCTNTIKGTTKHNMTYEGHTKLFCAASCMVSFKMKNIKMVSCAWCGTNKSNFDMIERVDANNKFQMFCSLNCLSLYRVNLQATSNQSIRCDQCSKNKPAQFHLTMSDASVRNFCSYSCVVDFQAQFSRPAKVTNAQSQNTNANRPTRQSSRTRNQQKVSANQTQNTVPVISNVMSLAGDDGGRTKAKGTSPMKPSPHVIIQHPEPKQVRNKSLLCKPYTQTKATTCRPHMVTKETQTDEEYSGKNNMFIPVPVPVYIPVPMAMYSVPTPYPLPLPVPVPVPCFIPTTKKSAGSILSHIKEIQERIPADPFEAELLMMAEAVEKADKGSGESDSSESESELLKEPQAKSTENGTGGKSDLSEEDLLQAAFRLADEMTAPDLELTGPASVNQSLGETDDSVSQDSLSRTGGTKRKQKRSTRSSKRLKKESSPPPPVLKATTPPAPLSDANMNLKFTYGVNAWKHWVVQKNANLERAVAMGGVHKLFKTDILQCSADELNYSLCLFVKEVRKPSGEEYNPDSIYYLCLGIQQYLFESGRVDNIFTDFYYEKFTDCLNEILQRFEVRLNPEGNIVCRIEEEHLWECQQLGAHSPYVLLNTLLFFNTKEYMLKTPQDHQKLSFTHILKQWRKGPSSKGGGRVAYLRFFPFGGQDKRKREDVQPYEQGENTGNPLRCPVKLYEFYLSKCPESIKNRNDLFYLVPERSCVPDSPVWYSTQPLPAESLSKMLNRLRLVREVQEAHLHCDPTQVVY